MKKTFDPQKKILIIDGNAFFYRSYYATVKLAQSFNNPNSSGLQSNAIFTTIRMLVKFLDEHPSYMQIFFTWDLGKKTFRHQIYPSYKANRKKTPDELIEQIPLFEKFLQVMKIDYFKNPDYEADDLIYALTNKALAQKLKVDVITSDRDLLQTVQPHVTLFLLKNGTTKMDIIDSNNFYQKFQIYPHQIVDFKALVGDRSDNLSGVKGVGPKTALTLLQKYHTLENIYAHSPTFSQDLQKKFLTDKTKSFLTKKLVKLNDKLALDVQFQTMIYNFQSPAAQQFYLDYKMFSLLKLNKQNKFKF